MLPAPLRRYLGGEARVHDHRVFLRHDGPDEVVHWHRRIVRLVAMKVFAAASLAGRVPDRVDLEVLSDRSSLQEGIVRPGQRKMPPKRTVLEFLSGFCIRKNEA